MIPFARKFQRQTCRTERKLVVAKVGAEHGVTANGYGISFGVDGNVLKLGGGYGVTTL